MPDPSRQDPDDPTGDKPRVTKPPVVPVVPIVPKPLKPVPVVPKAVVATPPVAVVPRAVVAPPAGVAPKTAAAAPRPATPTPVAQNAATATRKPVPVTPAPVAPKPTPASTQRATPSVPANAPAPSKKPAQATEKPAAAAAAAAAAPVAPKPVAPKLAEPVRRAPAPQKPTGPDPLIGKTVGRCRILSHLGAGRTAIVYRAHHEGLGTDVAVKILLPEILKFSEVVAKFELEARAIARLDHPNVLKIYDVVTEGETRGIVMELLDGESVLEYLEGDGGVEPQDALRIVRQAAAGLQAAHVKGIIHRDVKPQNLVILEDGTVKLVDFGLATQADASLAAERIGTPHYMAPEVCEAKPVETASDVYSLGITLYHLLTGHPPYAGQSVKEILQSHIAGKPLTPEREVKGLADPLADLVRGMTKRDPLTRMSIDTLIATIDRIGGDELVKSLKVVPRRGRRRRRVKSAAPIAMAIGGGVLLVVLLILLLSRKGTQPEPTKSPDEAAAPGIDPKTGLPPGTADPTPSEPNKPPPETPEEKRAREKKEADDRKMDAERAFEKAERYARENENDPVGIVQKYKEVAGAYPELERGKESKRRAEGIKNGTIHPHPDKVFAPKSEVEKAREAWEKVKAPIETAVAAGLYGDALHLLPGSIEDPDHKIGPEIEAWRAVLRAIPDFLMTLQKEAQTLKPADRILVTAKGPGRWVSTSTAGPVVEIGGVKQELRWGDFTPDSVAALADRAFDTKDVQLKAGIAAYAWAHKLREPFFRARVAFMMADASTDAAKFVSQLVQRAADRFPKPTDAKSPKDPSPPKDPKDTPAAMEPK
jgi:serine/threonine protein kinase